MAVTKRHLFLPQISLSSIRLAKGNRSTSLHFSRKTLIIISLKIALVTVTYTKQYQQARGVRVAATELIYLTFD